MAKKIYAHFEISRDLKKRYLKTKRTYRDLMTAGIELAEKEELLKKENESGNPS